MSTLNNSKGTFVRPLTIGICGSNERENLIDRVAAILAEDPLALKPGDELYDLALEQYNSGVRGIDTERMPIPAGFCGVPISENSGLKVIPLDGIIPGSLFDETTINPEATGLITTGIGYPPDLCLEYGPPGSYDYDLCGTDPSFDTPPEAKIPRQSISPNYFIIAVEERSAPFVNGAPPPMPDGAFRDKTFSWCGQDVSTGDVTTEDTTAPGEGATGNGVNGEPISQINPPGRDGEYEGERVALEVYAHGQVWIWENDTWVLRRGNA